MSRTVLAELAPVANRSAAPTEPAECRCRCGSLIARLVSGGVEIKCRSCKRLLLLPLAPGDVAWREIEVGP
jgi:hypothetical protein